MKEKYSVRPELVEGFFVVRQAVRVLSGRMPPTATAYSLRVHHERILVCK